MMAVLLAAILTAALFLAIPLSQLLDAFQTPSKAEEETESFARTGDWKRLRLSRSDAAIRPHRTLSTPSGTTKKI